jgi:hypothetical protein
MTCASVRSVVMVLIILGAVVFSDSTELILSPGVGVPILGSRTSVGSVEDAGELITIRGVSLLGFDGDGRGIRERRRCPWLL